MRLEELILMSILHRLARLMNESSNSAKILKIVNNSG